jgi:hypothetical protein
VRGTEHPGDGGGSEAEGGPEVAGGRGKAVTRGVAWRWAARTTQAGQRGLALGLTVLTGIVLVATGCGPAGQAPAVRHSASSAIPSALLSQARPIGAGRRFHPPVTGQVGGSCESALGTRYGVHVEVFAANRVLLLPAGIGTRPPRTSLDGRITAARCYGALATLDPTGLVLVRPGATLTLGALFSAWGQPLSPTRLASFNATAPAEVTVFVNGKPWPGAPAAVPLTRHAEIVLEVGPHVPPHSSYAFPPGS